MSIVGHPLRQAFVELEAGQKENYRLEPQTNLDRSLVVLGRVTVNVMM